MMYQEPNLSLSHFLGQWMGEEKERGAGEESGKEEEGTAVVSAAWAGAWQLLWGLPCMVTALLTSLAWY